jgi:transposase-like protein
VSATTVSRLTASWAAQYDAWSQRRLDDLEVVYCWADGLYVKAGLERGKTIRAHRAARHSAQPAP